MLQLLATEGNMDRYELEDRMAVSRRTVIRTADALAERGYIDQDGTTYHVTAYGSWIAQAYQRFTQSLTTYQRLQPLIAHLPRDTFDLDPRHLADAELLTVEDTSAAEMLQRALALRERATHLRELSPMVEKRSVDQLAQRVQSGDIASAEIVLSESAMQMAETQPSYQDAHQRVIEADSVTMSVSPDPIPFLLCIADDTVAIGATQDGRPYAFAVTSNEAVIEWAARTFRQFQDRSVPARQMISDDD